LAGFKNWKIIPYHVKFTEMIMRSNGIKKTLVTLSEKTVNSVEFIFPLTAGGMILDINI
jgi:hypothetical protein